MFVEEGKRLWQGNAPFVLCATFWCSPVVVFHPSLYLQGVGRRYANLVCKKADVDMNKRAGELSEEEVSKEDLEFK